MPQHVGGLSNTHHFTSRSRGEYASLLRVRRPSAELAWSSFAAIVKDTTFDITRKKRGRISASAGAFIDWTQVEQIAVESKFGTEVLYLTALSHIARLTFADCSSWSVHL